MKILQLCAAGVSARGLTTELERLGHLVIKGDCNPPDLRFVKVPNGQDKDFVEKINEYNRPVVILPHNQEEAFKIAEMGKSVISLLSSPVAIRETVDKGRLMYHLREMGLSCVGERVMEGEELFSDYSCNGKRKSCFAKPVDGCGSKGLIDFESQVQSKYLVTKKLTGQEFTIDCVCNQGAVIDICARKRLKAHGGICVDAEVLSEVPAQIDRAIAILSQYFYFSGPLAIQGFLEADGQFYITDVNHRFGGGSNMSTLAGWRGVENYCRILEGKESVKSEIKPIRVRRWFVNEVLNC